MSEKNYFKPFQNLRVKFLMELGVIYNLLKF